MCKMHGYWHEDAHSGRRTWIKATVVRRNYMMKVGEKRGEKAAEALREMVLLVWNTQFLNGSE